jgi:GH43 family beta-xylosidase
MKQNFGDVFSQTYLNPVYPRSFPDPYVFKFRGEYFAVCTDFWRDGKVFGILHSRDLVNWREVGGAMQRLDSDAPFYWAPEITYSNGKFYLYYSVGNETLMELRVAVSDRPDGGFVDAGKRLTSEEFAIDAHVFEDENGERFMFYATDFLTHTHIGTGTVVDRMIDFFTLEGKPRPVTRAKYDWQIYDPQRKEKGGVRWHTIEGSFVLKRKGIYYQMFSGGNWQNITYGVSFAVTDDIRRDAEWLQFSDGVTVFPILRTIPNLIIGPGHNSVARGVNNRELFCVYHRWTEHGRVLSIDRMDFAGGARMFISGATSTPQPAPFQPQVSDFFDEFPNANWETTAGVWRAENNDLICAADEAAEVECQSRANNFLAEVWLRAVENSDGKFGVALKNDEQTVFKFLLAPAEKRAELIRFENGGDQSEAIKLPEDFNFQAFHLLRVEADGFWVKIALDENTLRVEQNLSAPVSNLALTAENVAAAFSGFALTVGFENLFTDDDFEKRGWRKISESGSVAPENSNLKIAAGDAPTIVSKRVSARDFELAVNFRAAEIGDDFQIGFRCGAEDSDFFILANGARNRILKTADGARRFDLPEGFQPEVFHQIRFLKINGKIIVQLEAETLGGFETASETEEIALSVAGGAAEFDMVRLTVL